MAKPPMSPIAIANLMGGAAHKKSQAAPDASEPDADDMPQPNKKGFPAKKSAPAPAKGMKPNFGKK